MRFFMQRMGTLSIVSNIRSVIERLERFERQLPGSVNEVLQPSFPVHGKTWREIAVEEAERVLRLLADTPEEHSVIPRLVQTITVLTFGDTMEWTMSAGREQSSDFLQMLREFHIGGLFGGPQKFEQIQRIVEDWVHTPESEGGKRRDARDARKSDEEIARGILIILLDPDRTEGRALAANALLPHLQKFAEIQAQASTLSPEKLREWLEAVLGAWRDRLLNELPDAVREQIRELWRANKTSDA